MNLRFIITALLAAAVLFVYQAMSWMVLPIHKNSMKYTSQQDTILKSLSSLEDGFYGLPNLPPNSSQEEHEKLNKDLEGKPYAMITYKKSFHNNMARSMAIGFVLNLLAVVLALFMIRRMQFSSFLPKFLSFVFFGVFLVLQSVLMNWNWFQTPEHFLIPEIIDSIVGWSLVGIVAALLDRKQIRSY